ncbi:cysteine proteinase [Ceratobasidium sp. AG-I]|nr:cysteine proteinase [Ceratobasidium sp. AG-I]
MGKKEKAELAARRKAYFDRYGTQSDVPIPPGLTLPPGLVNLGNSCFLNSTLQSLTATPLLHALLTFTPPPHFEQERDLYPARSPALINARGPPGVQHNWESGMPISDAFLRFEDEAISARQTGKASLTPRELLGQIGSKYDQYLGYRQQDAHELLRHLLDGMRMEEMDIIKKRNPPPQTKPKSKRSRPASPVRPALNGTKSGSLPNGVAEPPSSTESVPGDPPTPVQAAFDDPPMPFVDMVFGGTLASILVCEGCKHISHTYEDFMDLSLSIKPEDAREKKREKFKFFTKFRKSTTPVPGRTPPPILPPASNQSTQGFFAFPSTETDPATSNYSSTVDVHLDADAIIPNGSGSLNGTGTEAPGDDRRGSGAGLPVSDGEMSLTHPQGRISSVQISTESGHDREDIFHSGLNSSSASVGARLGRRVSLQGWKRKDKDKEKVRGKSNERMGDKKDKDKDVNGVVTAEGTGKETEDDERMSRARSRPSSPPPAEKFISSAPMSRATSPARKNEVAYLKRVLADIGAPPAANPLALLRGATSDGLGILKDPFSRPSLDDVWLKLSSGRGSVTDALRSFTAVEVLEGDNAFACRRCWKIAHGVPVGRSKKGKEAARINGQAGKGSAATTEDSGDESDSDPDSSSEADSEDPGRTGSLQPQTGVPLRPASTSGVGAGLEQWARDTVMPRPSSAPMVEHNGPMTKMSIPSIEMTSPDSERPHPFAELYGNENGGVNGGVGVPLVRTTTRGSAETGSSGMTLELESGQSTAATSAGPPAAPISAGPVIASPVPRTPIALQTSALPSTNGPSVSPESHSQPTTNHNPSLVPNPALPAVPRSQQYIHRRALKRYLIATPPPVLVVHLKRFQQVGGAGSLIFGSLRKLDDFVAFPEVLDIAPFVAPNREEYGMGRGKSIRGTHGAGSGGGKVNGKGPVGWFGKKERERAVRYRLYAVVVHIGSMLGGHYIAYIALPPAPPLTPDCEDPPGGSDDAQRDKDKDLKEVSAKDKDKEKTKDKEKEKEKDKEKDADKDKRQWVYISDTTVRPVSFEEVSKAKAYLCFYERFYD